jgi:hypothetical protein
MIKFFGILLLFVLTSCVNVSAPKVDHSFPHTGSSNNAFVAVKDYETLGIIIVKSSEVIDGNGNHTGSKITWEMFMVEAQKLGADDVINIRIDVNQKIDFNLRGIPIRTTFDYTATALAIKYTTALAGEGIRVNNSENIRNYDIIFNRMRPSRESVTRESATREPANKKDNWLSVGATMLGVGLRYERIFNPYWSLGGDVYYQAFGIDVEHEFGIGVTARVYPTGRFFYFGAGLGIHGYQSWSWEWSWDWGDEWSPTYTIGFAVTPELGTKIDFNMTSGFFMDIGAKVPFTFDGHQGINVSIVPYIGFGVAF